ncbi:MAG: hypothetical protein ACI914_000710 [Candidatus Marivariicella framensis]|jgi:hypothetical protein|tara:strand:- start:13044 stop:13220 length:177 start_codon:yes stop_codon:yes gene_type:complete
MKQLKELMVIRNTHKAFGGEFLLIKTDKLFNVKWINITHSAEIYIDLDKMSMKTSFST